ncbi:MAG: phosphatase PAP2 family protein [Atopobiaceae bacterium]|jgi:undecaprenyl-diphosphatase|nr:phosphatase PAP2 family protein [Atopobiaceae bacterium]MCH4120194.1 phosphatase PAP2 family protein [Atopobiaceae bacterium]MCI1318708.1 phosphatase PAP2 family protein [Atopobiaceae bacterium]MCI1389771.1 phosphatase PAP2 family protein [Atopobiaceae bacterium]MCI1432471.1 phosphatase PAP2 family protein [Atopobiaceae bacterium]
MAREHRGQGRSLSLGQRIWWMLRRAFVPIVVLLSVIAFLMIMRHVQGRLVGRFDRAAYLFFVIRLRRPLLTLVMEGFSDLASPVVLAAMLLIIIAFAPGRRPGICATVNLVGIVALNQLLKSIVQRPRPDGYQLIVETGYSFPSGHSMVSMAFYGLLVWMVLHYVRDRRKRHALAAAFVVLIALVGISRIYLGVHYASDVVAGFLVSMAWLGAYTATIAPALMRAVPNGPSELYDDENWGDDWSSD